MQNMRNVKMPSGNAMGGLGRALLLGGATIYGAANSLFNVEGGHRAIVFNRLSGIKETVCWRRAALCTFRPIAQAYALTAANKHMCGHPHSCSTRPKRASSFSIILCVPYKSTPNAP